MPSAPSTTPSEAEAAPRAGQGGAPVAFREWVGARHVPTPGTNHGATPLAFQSWHRFKEAFSPEFVFEAITASAGSSGWCFDPFGGSGTTALTAQFLGVNSTTVEVNPFLVDVIRAKLTHYEVSTLTRELLALRERLRADSTQLVETPVGLPPTFVEPGVNKRWIFNAPVAARVLALRAEIRNVEDEAIARLFRVLLGGLLVEVSNVVVSGKGRRYRRNWKSRSVASSLVDELFFERAMRAIADVHKHSGRIKTTAEVVHGDARTFQTSRTYDVAVFSPPYPNSFDYTDVYNLELWMLGYLQDSTDNRLLRSATLSSHVQLHREYTPAPQGSDALDTALVELGAVRLWSRWIPHMVGAYFADLLAVLRNVHGQLRLGGECWLVVGDSRYAGVTVPVADILVDLAGADGWEVKRRSAFRAMRSSAQQGGTYDLPESLIVLARD